MGGPRQGNGRVNQKRRTRAAIVGAAAELVRRGKTPTVGEVADAAAVSRATAYRYFPTQAYLLAEAALEGVPAEIDRVLAGADARTPEARLDELVRALQERIAAHEPGFRALLRLSLEQPFADSASDAPRRGGRRVDWIERALAPLWDRMDAPTRERLVGALALCMGVEALVALRDACGYGPEQAVDVCRWAARSLVRAALNEPSR